MLFPSSYVYLEANLEGVSEQVNVHQECYGIVRVPQGVWLCQPCTELQRQSQSLRSPGVVAQANMLWAQCALCCRGAGALKRSTDGRWVHVFCAQVKYLLMNLS